MIECSLVLVPCFLISCLTILGFLLAPDSGEKLTLRKRNPFHQIRFLKPLRRSEITILLSVVTFSLLISDIMPPSSTAIPIITVYFLCVMTMSTISVTASVLVISLHFRNAKTYTMPFWVRSIFSGILNSSCSVHLDSEIYLPLFGVVLGYETTGTSVNMGIDSSALFGGC